MSDQEDGDKVIPDVAICQKLCESFASITDTDTACAQFFLQDRDWDLARSVDAYFDLQSKGASGNSRRANLPPDDTGDSAQTVASSTNKSIKFKFISWNIDGLDNKNMSKRMKAVCSIIQTELPNAVHLQEVVPTTWEYIRGHLPDYKCIAGNDAGSDYFTATLLHQQTMTYEDHIIDAFPGSLMGRTRLTVKAKFGSIPLLFMNSHLESTAEHSKERLSQLQQTFKKVLSAESDRTVLFAGDLNLREKELGQIGSLPTGIEDLWVTCGSREECRFTWDSVRNINISFDGGFQRFKPRCRFDRIFLRHSNPGRLNPKFFGLIGLEKVRTCQCFPSDHWGLITHFEV